MGANKHTLLENVINHPEGCIVEFGCGSNSTPFLQNVCDEKHISFFGADLLEYNDSLCRKENYFQMSGEKFMQEVFPIVNKVIVGAYLDNFDWTWEPLNVKNNVDALQQYNEYKSRGTYLSNYESSLTHLRQVKEIVKYCIPGSLIVFDDTWININNETFAGKGNAAIYYLLTEGWRLVEPFTHEQINTDCREEIKHYVHNNMCMHFMLRKD